MPTSDGQTRTLTLNGDYFKLKTVTDSYGGVTSLGYYDSTSGKPVGSVQRITKSNQTFEDYDYDILGRLKKMDYTWTQAGAGMFKSIELTYDDAGMIIDKDYLINALEGPYNTEYTYDDAYRLVSEHYFNADIGTDYFTRSYTYDNSGNRKTMHFGKTTTYNYSECNEMTDNTGYYRFGTVDTGPMSFRLIPV